jgi:multiple sugar transport system substrate-binding protein
MTGLHLKGIAWNHSRAFPPLVATAQRYEELNPGVRITWEKRTLHEFGHANLAQLADRYDLLVIDHPMMGEAAAALVDLYNCLEPGGIQHLRRSYVGQSFECYLYHGGLFALPIDAAAPAASFRPDLIDLAGVKVPATWTDLLDLARLGRVGMPGFPADLFLNWMALCVSRDGRCANGPDHLFPSEIALASLEDLKVLASFMPASIYDCNPITLYEEMATGDSFAYSPFAYTYSNYSRRGFAANLLRFAAPVGLSDGPPMRTVLGGTGIAVSRKCASVKEAVSYSLFVADPLVQRDLYGPTGGQPSARLAWDDPLLDQSSNGFFSATRSSIESAYVRPRYRGYIPLQERAGVYVARYLQGQIGAHAALNAINERYRDSLEVADQMDQTGEVQRHA